MSIFSFRPLYILIKYCIQPALNHQFFNIEKATFDTTASTSQFVAIALMLGPNKNTYSRSVFTIMNMFGNVGGIYGFLQSVWGILVGVVSTQIMLASVFRRLYYTDKSNFENLFIKIIDRSRRVANMPEEEIKSWNLKSICMSKK